MEIRPLTREEQKYTYSQSMQLQGQTGSIGYLRGDFDKSGYGFFSNFTDHRKQYKTDEFRAEIDVVVNALRSEKYGLLQNRSEMKRFAKQYPNSAFQGNYTTEFGFRVDTKNHAYLLRCNPSQGDYNFYCYCYVSKWLDKHMENAKRGIRFIDPNYKELFYIPDGGKIVITNGLDEKMERTCRYINEYHVEIGNYLYHICEFAERMKQNGSSYEPKQEESQLQLSTEPEENHQEQRGENRKEEKLKFDTNGTTEQVELLVNVYANDNSLYVGLTSWEDGYPEPYGDVTVNLSLAVPNFCAFVDTNNMPEIEEFLVKNEIAEFTGLTQPSGLCTYPLYFFNERRLKELCPDGVAVYEQKNGLDHEPQEKKQGR